MNAQGILARHPVGKRILGIWDFHSTAASIGDGIAFQAMLNVLRIEKKVDKIDLCYIDDQGHPYARRAIFQKNLLWKRNIAMTACVNPHMGSIFHFDSNDQFARFFVKNRDSYHCHPHPYVPFGSPSNWRILTEFFERHRYLPALSCRPELINWALRFVDEHVRPAKIIVVHLRNNTRYSEKNSPIDAWRDFFLAQRARREVKFVVVGMKDEVIPEFRSFGNVLFSKDMNTSLEQDLALIQVSHAGLYHSSGMMAYTWFCGVPSVTVGVDPRHVHYGHALSIGGKYNFMNKFQTMIWEQPTASLLDREFAGLLEGLEKERWQNSAFLVPVEHESDF